MAGLCEGGNEPPGSLKATDGNKVAARQLYTERYSGRHLPCGKTFARIHQRLLERGAVQKRVSDVGRPREVPQDIHRNRRRSL
ncbi:hypothetical protein ANN_11640 [Periplaneta americana]|uniref:Uncharacterized protein n=1 Tax=Periplaneta americana TaxID=6978 RepID=A0ABQ8T7E2_PERAM|nr:hypothetical protein ANN_11640 [Periplaneta americana]